MTAVNFSQCVLRTSHYDCFSNEYLNATSQPQWWKFHEISGPRLWTCAIHAIKHRTSTELTTPIVRDSLDDTQSRQWTRLRHHCRVGSRTRMNSSPASCIHPWENSQACSGWLYCLYIEIEANSSITTNTTKNLRTNEFWYIYINHEVYGLPSQGEYTRRCMNKLIGAHIHLAKVLSQGHEEYVNKVWRVYKHVNGGRASDYSDCIKLLK